MLNMAIITGFLSKTKDRFHEYNAPLELDEKFALMADIEGYDGVEIVYPYEVSDPAATRQVLDKYGLKAAAVNVNVKAEPEFRNGGLTSVDPAIRAKAVQFIKDSKDFAAAVGADKVTCCPLGDGYEFSFQNDYAVAWKHLIETFSEAGDYRKEIPLFIEYKPSETRGRCFIDTAAKSLCLLNDYSVTAEVFPNMADAKPLAYAAWDSILTLGQGSVDQMTDVCAQIEAAQPAS